MSWEGVVTDDMDPLEPFAFKNNFEENKVRPLIIYFIVAYRPLVTIVASKIKRLKPPKLFQKIMDSL